MSEGGPKKRKSKAWYRKQAYHNKRMKTEQKPGHRLTAGLKGFIITCNERERDAVKESYNILNEYADKLYGPEIKEEADSSGESDGDDIEAAIAKEVQGLKDATAKGERRFQNSQTGAKNCIFIKTTVDDPVALAYAIFEDLYQSKQQKSRHALRLLPVVGTCKASVKEINELAKVVLLPFFTETKLEVTFTVTFKARNNNGIGREMVISTLRETIKETFPSVLLRFTHVNPDITILVEVMCGVACIAVAKDFALFRKYNLVEVAHDKPDSTESSTGVKSEKPEVTQTIQSESGDKVDSQQKEMNEMNHETSDSECRNIKSVFASAEAAEKPPDTDPPSGQESVTATSLTSEAPDTAKTASSHGVSGGTDDGIADACVVSGEEPPSSPKALDHNADSVAVVSDCATSGPEENVDTKS